MGFFSKLNPFKKKDDFGDLGKDLDLGKDFGMGTGPSPELGSGLEPLPGQDPLQKYPHSSSSNFSLLIRLSSLRSSLLTQAAQVLQAQATAAILHRKISRLYQASWTR